ncbi:MAG: hypothetical protein ACK4RZ_14295 [Paracoccaceae bacterium]
MIGNLLIFLAAMMLAPVSVDFLAGLSHARDFLESAFITDGPSLAGRLAMSKSDPNRISTRQACVLTVQVWTGRPLFACSSFILGAPELAFVIVLAPVTALA